MDSLNDALLRLLRSAARAPRRETKSDLSLAVEARVLAGWRSSESADPLPAGVLSLLRRGLVFACAVMLAAVALSVVQVHRGTSSLWTAPLELVDASYLR